MELNEVLRVGLIQTTTNEHYAWQAKQGVPLSMQSDSQLDAWREIKKGFIHFKNHKTQPHIVLIPELSLPNGFERDVVNISKKINAIVIAGLDFVNLPHSNKVMNKGIISIPNKWPSGNFSRSAQRLYFGKTFFSYEEKDIFSKSGKNGLADPSMYIFDAGPFGRIGLAICSDFFDIERFAVYKGRIHHMIVISYNKDISTYYFLSEAIARLVYCNVVICNTGFYGGSVAFSPYNKIYKRSIYKHEGANLFTSQIVELPVKSLDEAQQNLNDKVELFKAKPPGYVYES